MLNLGPFYNQVSSWIDMHKNAAHYFSLLSIAIVFILTCLIFFVNKIKHGRLIFNVLSVFTIIIFRGLSLYADSYNPDEGMHLANAIALLHDGRLWVSTDTTTFGPISALIILLVHAVINVFFKSVGISYFLLRLINIIIISVSFVLLNSIFELRLGKKTARALSLFYVLFFSFNWNPDLQAFNSEYTYMLFISLSLYYLCRFEFERDFVLLLKGAYFAGIMPYIKLQVMPMSVIIICWGAFLIFKKERSVIFEKNIHKIKKLFFYIGITVMPTLLLFFFCMTYENGLANAWFYYFVNAAAHIGSHGTGEYILYLFRGLLPMFLAYEWYDSIIIMAIVSILVIYKTRTPMTSSRFFSCLLFLFTVGAVILPMRNFTHYIIFLIPPSLILAMEALVVLLRSKYKWFPYNEVTLPTKIQNLLNRDNIVGTAVIGISILLFGAFHENVSSQTILSSKWLVGRANQSLTQMSKYVVDNTNESDSIVVWGWEQRVFVYANRRSGTAQTDIQRLYGPYPEKNIFMYISDIHKNKPKLIVDIVAPGSFAFSDENVYSLEKHPKVWAAISNNYELIEKIPVGEGTYKVYLRKD